MKNSILSARLRDWHLWFGIVLTIPLLIIGVTTIYLIHKKSFEGPMLLPKGGDMQAMQKAEEARSVLPMAAGTRLVASEKQLYRQRQNGTLEPISEVSEVRDLLQIDENNAVVASKTGLWLWTTDQAPTRVQEGEWHSLASAGGRLFATGKQAIVGSQNGKTWEIITQELTEPAPKVFVSTADGRQWFGGKDGLVVRQGTEAPRTVVTEEIFDLQLVGEALLAAGKGGIWRVSMGDSATTSLASFPVRSLTLSGQTLMASGKQGVWEASSQQTEQWSAVDLGATFAVASNDKPVYGKQDKEKKKDNKMDQAEKGIKSEKKGNKRGEGFRFDKLMKDLHTGKFLGKFQWIWGDLLGLSMIFFGISGLVMWWRSRGVLLKQAETAVK